MSHLKKTIAMVTMALCLSPLLTLADEPALSKAEFDRLLVELNLKNQPWATIDWKISLTTARRVAAKQNRPVFMVVNTGNCLGFV